MTKHVLAGDIGGTHARFALFEVDATPRFVHGGTLDSRSYPSLEKALDEFLSSSSKGKKAGSKIRLAAASLGIAGPVVDQRVKTTNLPWTIDARKLSKHFKIPEVTLLNDLVAIGMGAIASPPSKLSKVHAGRPKRSGANLAVIAAGTGLGEALFLWDGKEHVACPSEGAHVDFAPRTDVEIQLFMELRKELRGHVSYERVVAASQIARLYRFFLTTMKVKESNAVTAEVAKADDANAAVCDLALEGKSEAAMRAIDLWCSVYGAETGNLVLKTLATGGVYVCGGVSTRLAKVIAHGLPARKDRTSPFVAAFLDKGRMGGLVEATPVAICTDPRAGLLGAAAHAAGRV